MEIPGTGGKSRFSRSAWGLEIWELINSAFCLLYEPELQVRFNVYIYDQTGYCRTSRLSRNEVLKILIIFTNLMLMFLQNQKLTVFAARFFKYGCRSSHLKVLGDSIQEIFSETLGIGKWNNVEQLAWKWFWSRVNSSLTLACDARERNFAEIVSTGWSSIRARNSDQAFGDAFYAEMQKHASELLFLFVRPKTLQYSTFVALMETVVTYVEDPEEFYYQESQVKKFCSLQVKY